MPGETIFVDTMKLKEKQSFSYPTYIKQTLLINYLNSRDIKIHIHKHTLYGRPQIIKIKRKMKMHKLKRIIEDYIEEPITQDFLINRKMHNVRISNTRDKVYYALKESTVLALRDD